jgi:hypothetical protein
MGCEWAFAVVISLQVLACGCLFGGGGYGI